jgi:predicted KAP-like P-loop ATPase
VTDDAISAADDSPLTDSKRDRLGRRRFAERIASTFGDRTDRSSLVIGLYGSWGEGKTSVLNFVDAALAGRDEIVVVHFNPWLLRDAPTMMLGFFETLASAVGRRMPAARKQIAGFLRGYGTAMSAISLNLAVVSIRPGDAVRNFAQDMGTASLQRQRRGFEKLLRDSGKRVLVLVDDLDRLDDVETHAMFQLVKLGAAFEGVSYLLAVDSDKVARALAPRYGSGDPRGGYDFLEKIVQVPLHLPRARSSDLLEMADEALGEVLETSKVELTDAEQYTLQRRFQLGVAPLLTTPRAAVRFGNGISFAMPLLRGEANTVDLITLEAIRATVPELYSAMRSHPDWFLLSDAGLAVLDNERPAQYKKSVDTLLEPLAPEQADACRHLIRELFPRTAKYWGDDAVTFDDPRDWLSRQRVASEDYFDRFFSYSVPKGQLSDELVRGLLGSGQDAATAVRSLVGRNHTAKEALLEKLSQHLDSLPPGEELALMQALADWGPEVTDPEARPSLLGASLGDATAAVIARLLLKLEADRRLEVAREILNRINPLSFAVDCLRAFTSRPRAGLDAPFAKDAVEPLKAVVVERTRQAAKEGDRPLWEAEARGMTLLFLWAEAAHEEVTDYVRSRIDREPTSASSLIRRLAGMAWSGPSPHQSDFDENSFRSLHAIADPAVIASVLSTRYGEGAGATYEYVEDAPDPDAVLASQFLFIWRKNREAQGGT